MANNAPRAWAYDPWREVSEGLVTSPAPSADPPVMVQATPPAAPVPAAAYSYWDVREKFLKTAGSNTTKARSPAPDGRHAGEPRGPWGHG